MPDREKVIKRAERIMCSTVDRDMIDSFCEDVIALLEEQEHKDRMFHALEDDWKRVKELLKEQEAKPLRCKTCTMRDKTGFCHRWNIEVKDNDYCSFGAWKGC